MWTGRQKTDIGIFGQSGTPSQKSASLEARVAEARVAVARFEQPTAGYGFFDLRGERLFPLPGT